MTATEWLTAPQWEALAADAELPLLALWGEPGIVRAAFQDGDALRLVALLAEDGQYPSLSRARPSAALFERAAHDLWALEPVGTPDGRPWLDHGNWPVLNPLSGRPVRHATPPSLPEFLPAEGEALHRLPMGPILPGIGEPGYLHLSVAGETIVRLEARLGYAHKGTLGLMPGKSPRAAARFPARMQAEATVAHSLAFALAAERATGAEVPPRAIALRAVMAEIERIAVHLRVWQQVLELAGPSPLADQAGLARETLLAASQIAFGHRLLMDRVMPGGVALDLEERGLSILRDALLLLAQDLPRLGRATLRHGPLMEALAGLGTIRHDQARAYATGGPTARASAVMTDARMLGDTPYVELDLEIPLQADGDAAARLEQRIAETVESRRLLATMLDALPDGPVSVSLPQRAGEGAALVEAAHGPCLAWLALDDGGLIRAAMARDPGWGLWPLLEAAAPGTTTERLPLLMAGLGLTMSGMDL
ncbi:hydrogenase large subunit [Rhodovarius crocodyli]|nr:NADH-quinone oxidoreductase subunit C [Rhodovarius crocodyli]